MGSRRQERRTAKQLQRPPAHADTTWVAVGDAVVFHPDRPAGERRVGIVRDARHGGDSDAWLVTGCRGIVVEAPSRGSARHRCPDHHRGEEECVCGGDAGDDPGWIPARPTSAVVAWEMSDGGAPYQRLIFRDNEGEDWGRADQPARLKGT